MIPNSSPESAPEIQLLQSRMILGKTIAELNLRDIVEQKYFPIVGRGWARLTKEKPGELAISWMHIPQLNGQDQQLTLTVGKTATIHWKVKSSPSMVWSASVWKRWRCADYRGH